MKSWLESDPQHVAVVHCKVRGSGWWVGEGCDACRLLLQGGKGRTGCVIAAFMHYTEVCHR